MRKNLLYVVSLTFLLLTGCKVVKAQAPPTAGMVIYQGFAPTGTCNLPNYLTIDTLGSQAGVYQCKGASPTWQQVGIVGVGSINSVTGDFTFSGPGVDCTGDSCVFSGTGTGIGSITWTLPSWLTASPNPLTVSGTQTFSAAGGQTAHQVIGTCGASTAFGPCLLTAGDIPSGLPYLSNSTQLPITATVVAHNFLASYTSSTGLFTLAQPAFTDLSGHLGAAQGPTGITGLIKDDGAGNLVTAIPGTDYVTPSGAGITALTGDVTAAGPGSAAATLATVSSTFGTCGDSTHVCQMTTNAKGLTTAQTQVAITPGAVLNPAHTMLLPNDSSGTTQNFMAQWHDSDRISYTIIKSPINGAGPAGTDLNVPLVGVCVSNCGTSGYGAFQFIGNVSWSCDDQVFVGDWVTISSTTAGECDDPLPGPPTAALVNENPEHNSIVGVVSVANSGAHTVATINLMPFYGFGQTHSGQANHGQAFMLSAYGSPFLSTSYWTQNPSTASGSSGSAYALNGNAPIDLWNSSGFFEINPGLSGLGTSGRDIVFDNLSQGYGIPPTGQGRFNMSTYHVPNIANVTGTKTLDVGTTTGLYIWTLTGNTTLATPSDDNAGHVLSFDVVQAASGGPFTFTWPGNFVGAPTISATPSTSTLAQFMYDGSHYNFLGGSGSGGAGTTTNPLTANNTGSGASSGTTFNGAAAVTLSYNTIGAPGLAATTNTFTGTTNDYSATTQIKLPLRTAYTSAANGELGYDTTNLNWHGWTNGVDSFLAMFSVASPPTTGHMATFTKSTNSWSLTDGGAVPVTLAAVAHNFLTSYTSTTGLFTQAQPAFTDISGTAAAAQLPNPTSSSLGGVESLAATTHQWINTISTSGVPASTQPAFTDVSGNLGTAQAPNLTGILQDTAGTVSAATGHQLQSPVLCADVSGSGTAQACTTTPSFTPAANDCVVYTTTTANTGAALSLNVNGLGAKSVAKWLGTTTLATNDVLAGQAQFACYNGTVWNLSTIGNAPTGTGTVTHTAGALTLDHVALGNGSGDLTVDPDFTTDGAGNATATSYASNGAGGGVAGGYDYTEGTTESVSASGHDRIQALASTHRLQASLNGAAYSNLVIGSDIIPVAQGGTNTASPAFTTQTDSASVTWAISSALIASTSLTMVHTTSTRALNLTGLVNGGSYTIIFKQDSTGGAAATLGTGCTWYQGGSSGFTALTTLALTTTANAINILSFIYDGTNCYGNLR